MQVRGDDEERVGGGEQKDTWNTKERKSSWGNRGRRGVESGKGNLLKQSLVLNMSCIPVLKIKNISPLNR